MKIQDFDFELPPELIAQFPAEQRTGSRMLCLNGSTGITQDALFADLHGDSLDWSTFLRDTAITSDADAMYRWDPDNPWPPP